jgi:predicted transcriptional regulator
MARKSRLETYGSPLGPLELEIMEFLWASGASSGRDVFSGIKAGREVALTTVLTVLERLAKKGLVLKHKGAGLIAFSPALSKEEFARTVSKDVFKGILGISASGLCASFVDALAASDPEELEKLSELIESKKKELGSGEGRK